MIDSAGIFIQEIEQTRDLLTDVINLTRSEKGSWQSRGCTRQIDRIFLAIAKLKGALAIAKRVSH